jgi:hypothetical protein
MPHVERFASEAAPAGIEKFSTAPRLPGLVPASRLRPLSFSR